MKIEKDFRNKFTKKDYIIYLINRNMVLLLSPVIIIALLVAIVFALINEGFSFLTLIYALPIILFILSYIQMYRVIKHTLKSQAAIQELKITLTDNEYKDCTNGEVNSITYDKLYCYKETKDYFYLYVDKMNALILPKREFSEEELEKIKTTFNNKIKKESIYPLSSWFMVGIMILLVVLIVYNIIVQ